MAKTSLYEGKIRIAANKLAKKFPEHIRAFAKKTIESLLETGRDLALVDAKRIDGGTLYVDTAVYITGFERNTETIASYCEHYSESEKPITMLKALDNYDNIQLIRFLAFRQAISELPLDIEELKSQLDSLKKRLKKEIDSMNLHSMNIEDYEAHFSPREFYSKTPYDSKHNYEADVVD